MPPAIFSAASACFAEMSGSSCAPARSVVERKRETESGREREREEERERERERERVSVWSQLRLRHHTPVQRSEEKWLWL